MKNHPFKIFEVILSGAIILLASQAWAQGSPCCTRRVAVTIQSSEGDVPTRIFENALFGSAFNDCPISIEKIILPNPGKGIEDWQGLVTAQQLDYVFIGEHTGELDKGVNTLKVNLIHVPRLDIVQSEQVSWESKEDYREIIAKLAEDFDPLGKNIYHYEGMPLSAQIQLEQEIIDIGDIMTIRIPGLLHDAQPAKAWQSIFISVQHGSIGGVPEIASKLWTVIIGDQPLELLYYAPRKCEDLQETITVYNTCDYVPINQLVPGRKGPQAEIGKASFKIVCPAFMIAIHGKTEYKRETEDWMYNGIFEINLNAQFRTESNGEFLRDLDIEKLGGTYTYKYYEAKKECPNIEYETTTSSGQVKILSKNLGSLMFLKKSINPMEFEDTPLNKDLKVWRTPNDEGSLLPNSVGFLLSYSGNEVYYQSHSCSNCCKSDGSEPPIPEHQNKVLPELQGELRIVVPLKEMSGQRTWLGESAPSAFIYYIETASEVRTVPSKPEGKPTARTTLEWRITKQGPGGV